jgi:SNF2 family DNA or RNA helicase
VLFCTLTAEQRALYRGYLGSKELAAIFAGSCTALAGIDILRKICNHPDLLERAKWEAAEVGGGEQQRWWWLLEVGGWNTGWDGCDLPCCTPTVAMLSC